MSWQFIFILLAYLHICFIYTNFVSSQCLQDQKSLLLKLRTNLEFDHSQSTKLVHWDESTDCCQWDGVQCSNSTGRVIGLDLSQESISNGIDSLFQLKSLESLNLANNYFSQEIPSEFGELTNLTYLNLSSSDFYGQVPVEISYLTNLMILDMSSYTIYMDSPNLETIIRHMSDIRELYLHGVSVSDQGKDWCEALSSALPHLEVLSMSNCNLTGEICSSLAKLHSLSVINLNLNNFSAPLPEFLAGFKNLTTLSLNGCGLIGVVPQEIFQVPTLRNLDLSYNEMLRGSLPEFQQNGSLETLVLKFTNFPGSLPRSLGNLQRLHTLDLGNCGLHGIIPSSIRNLNLLEDLDLSSNRFYGPIPSLSSLKNLKTLFLKENSLTGSIKSTNWGGLLYLERIYLSNNSLTGSIPTSLFSVPSLTEIDLSENKFSGYLNEFPRVPSSVLSYLDLSRNQLEGQVPKSIFLFKNLEQLDLSRNNFNGTLELNEILTQLQNLFYLDLSHNHLMIDTKGTGENIPFPQLNFLYLASCNLHVVPEFLKNQSKLVDLDLSNNQIKGRIPRWIWKVGNPRGFRKLNLSCNGFFDVEHPLPYITSLEILDLHSNKLQGEVPIPPMSTLVGLTYMDYSNNSFTSIQPDIGNSLSLAIFFSLSRNNIHGTVPTSVCNATRLQVLNLGYNHLIGTIPDCLIAMSQTLAVLDVRGNQLEGIIPDKFEKGCMLETLDLNGNFLKGKIPRSLDNCKQLKVLNLGNNQLNDTFPCHLRSLSNLQVLILRSNKFHGTITCQEKYSAPPLLQIVDLASNHFNGEITAQLLLKWTSMTVETNDKKSDNFLHYVENRVNAYYQNDVEITFKGQPYELQKILVTRTSIDLSNNAFQGTLVEELGNLKALRYLNLSHNYFSGEIPSSIGNLRNLESLDLSCNSLRGSIPQEMAKINALAVMNVSLNELEGKIPTGTQLQSFNKTSYTGNKRLCGPPLPSCLETPELMQTSSSPIEPEMDWVLRGSAVGFPVGVAVIVGPLFYIKKWKLWLEKLAMKILCRDNRVRERTRPRQRRKQPSSKW